VKRALALTALIALAPQLTAAKGRIDDRISAQQAKIHAVHQRLQQKRAELDDARAKVGSIQSQLAETNRNIAAANGHLAELEGRMRSMRRQLAWNQIQLTAARATLQRHENVLARRLVDAYEHGDLGYLDVLLRAQSFADFVERWNDIRFLVRANEATIRERRADENKVVAIQGRLLGTRAQLQDQQAQARQQQLALEALASQRRILLAAADTQRQTVQTEVDQLDEESAGAEAALEELIRQKQAEEEARRLAARRAAQLAGEAVPEEPSAPGQLIWPVSGPISSPFGMRTNPITHAFILHAGIDIAVPTGTTVVAAAEGRVIVAGWDDGGCGNMIVIDHGGHLATQYCHLSQMYVGVGQDVQRGQAIAASGSTGNSTGPHVHFGVRIDGRPVDPMTYLH
jgi:murein DD-endopeptidase MepM/ murein hydrolase activator NlpD